MALPMPSEAPVTTTTAPASLVNSNPNKAIFHYNTVTLFIKVPSPANTGCHIAFTGQQT
jgi:hypothetical protein